LNINIRRSPEPSDERRYIANIYKYLFLSENIRYQAGRTNA